MLNKNKRTLCALCKGSRRLCGKPVCPILERFKVQVRTLSKVSSEELYGATPPSLLVGEYGYPKVRVGINLPPEVGEEAKDYDNPEGWWGVKGLRDIISLRSSMIYSSFKVNVKEAKREGNRLLEALKEAALSLSPVKGEASLKAKPKPYLSFDTTLAPIGPKADLKRWENISNPKVPRLVGKVVGDTDLRAAEALKLLFEGGISLYHIVRLLSLGLIGRSKSRRLVPTRWAITAVDKIISDYLVRELRDYGEYPNLELKYVEYLGNRYAILLVPGPWSYEMVEIWLPNSIWVKEGKAYSLSIYEGHNGVVRGPMDGGYYAIRVAVAEWLAKLRKQATVIAFREVTPDYYAPVGAWQIRESVRNALRGRGEVLSDVEEALMYLRGKLSTPPEWLARGSKLIGLLLKGRKLTDFVGG